MKKIAIQGHSTRGKDVINILKLLGGKDPHNFSGNRETCYYFINAGDRIDLCSKKNKLMSLSSHTFYTLEEYEQKFNNIKMLFTSANLLPNEINDTSINGISFKQNTDKSINITGTSTSNCELSLAGSPIQVESIFYFLKDIKYYLNGLDENITLKFYKYDGSDRNFIGEYTNESTINWSEDVEVSEIALYIPNGTEIDTTIYPMLQVASESINSYVPYKENSLDISLGENTFEPGDTIVIEKGEAHLTKDRYIHTGSCFVPDYEIPNYTTLYFNFPDDLYKTLPIEKTDIFICGDDTTGIYVEDKKIYFVTSRYSGERLDVEIYDKENNINLENGKSQEVTYENQKSFLETSLGQVINGGVDLGLKALLPDIIEDEIMKVLDTWW